MNTISFCNTSFSNIEPLTRNGSSICLLISGHIWYTSATNISAYKYIIWLHWKCKKIIDNKDNDNQHTTRKQCLIEVSYQKISIWMYSLIFWKVSRQPRCKILMLIYGWPNPIYPEPISHKQRALVAETDNFTRWRDNMMIAYTQPMSVIRSVNWIPSSYCG